jgi:hypothetical protein
MALCFSRKLDAQRALEEASFENNQDRNESGPAFSRAPLSTAYDTRIANVSPTLSADGFQTHSVKGQEYYD